MNRGEEQALDLAILNDHHRDTFGHIKAWEMRRDRIFYVIATLVGFLFLGVYYPSTVRAVFANSVTIFGAEIDLASLPVEILVSFGWSILFALALRYCQASITVDRQYDYLHGVERKMAALSGDGDLFQREGSAYLSDYPAFSKWVYFFYAGIFPLTVVSVSAWLLAVECTSTGERFHAIFDAFMWLGVATSFFLYRLWPMVTKKRAKGASNKAMQTDGPSGRR